jgi:cellulose synthase/poly-beta-1,6-N-acetylglucosamine synthase-like glycosyltransferase
VSKKRIDDRDWTCWRLLVSLGWLPVALITGIGIVIAACALYLLALAGAALFYRAPTKGAEPASRLTVLVPAHNEADFIQRCVESLKHQDYPEERRELVVIADNCTDRTAELAGAAGATVLVRTAPKARGKGQALRWAIDDILRRTGPLPDGFVVVDGDSVADRDLLRGLSRCLEQGADAAQAEYLVLNDSDSPAVQLRAVAFMLFHRVRFAGRSVLRLPCTLVGNGMLLSRRLMEQHPWDAFTGAEDLEYSVTLRLNGVEPVFAGDVRVRGPVPASSRAAQIQRERWEGGRLRVAGDTYPRLLREIVLRRRLRLVDLAVDLAIPPVGLLAVGACAGAILVGLLATIHMVSVWLLGPWLAALTGVAGFVFVGLRAAKAPGWMYRRLFSTPAFLLRKVLGTVRVVRSRSSDSWVRTERPSEIAR